MGTIDLDNATLQRWLDNAALVSEFPFLRTAKEALAQPRRQCCGGVASSFDWNSIREQIAALSGAARERFKTLVGVGGLRIIYRSSQGMQNVVI